MDLFLQANAAFSKFSRNYMQLKKDLPVRPSEMGVLNIIVQTPGPHTPLILAELIGVSKPMIAAHLSALSEKGYIEKRQSAKDGRVYHILPTEKAVQLVRRTREVTDGQLGKLAEKMGMENFEMLVRLIADANRIMEAKKDESGR